MSRHKRRSEGAACARRGYHASGADIVRPSESSTDRVSAVTRTSVANASRLLAVKELIPALQQLLFVVLNQHSDPIEVFSPEPMTSFQSNWGQPKLRLAIIALDMDMGRLTTVAGVEEYAERSASQDSRHVAILVEWLARDNCCRPPSRQSDALAPLPRR
jgi:hypothetical protein